MAKLLLMGGIMLMAMSENLVYRTNTEVTPIQGEMIYEAKVTGPEALTTQLLASNSALSIQHLKTLRTARRMPAPSGVADSVEIVVDTAQVEGRAADKPFHFQFAQPAAPAGVAADPVGQFAWGLSMAPRRYTLGPKGAYRLTDAGQDAQAEAVGVIVDAPVRLPDRPVGAGDHWTTEWNGIARKKDGGIFHYQQRAVIEEIVGASERARISFSTSALMYDASGKPLQGEETKLDAKGAILLDLRSGVVLHVDSTGTMSTEIKTAGLKVAFLYSSKYDLK